MLRGRCYCGAVAFEVDTSGDIELMGYCHCAWCTRAHSTPMYWSCWMDESRFKMIRGEDLVCETAYPPYALYPLTEGKRTSKSLKDGRLFCAQCGTRVMNRGLDMRGRALSAFFPALVDRADRKDIPLKCIPLVHNEGDPKSCLIYGCKGAFGSAEGEPVWEAVRVRGVKPQGRTWPAVGTLEKLEELRADLMADDIEIDLEKMSLWTEAKATSYFERGGEEVTVLRGHCWCHAIEFEVDVSQVVSSYYCHCQWCTRIVAAPLFWACEVEQTRFKITKGEGLLRVAKVPDDSPAKLPEDHQQRSSEGKDGRNFCSDCGTHVCHRGKNKPTEDVVLTAWYPALVNRDDQKDIPSQCMPRWHNEAESCMLFGVKGGCQSPEGKEVWEALKVVGN
ncbi:hypothetical protein AB1Y20_008168 [Prymnesium parvum]|uniref:CENP-V/GFA domain-containing protein n=1 Tax=Prymnesium parvum TaxID=97485 RepID=A0AB34ITL7_PRYPA